MEGYRDTVREMDSVRNIVMEIRRRGRGRGRGEGERDREP